MTKSELTLAIEQAASRGGLTVEHAQKLLGSLLASGQTEGVMDLLTRLGLIDGGTTHPPEDAQTLVGTASGSWSSHGSLHDSAFASVDTGALPSVDGDPDASQGGWSHGHEVGSAAVNPDLLDPSFSGGELDGESRPPNTYALRREIARGGVGAITMVEDRELMRTLVMKTLIEGRDADPYVVKKFVEEAQITAQLEHPNIVPVHSFGRFSGGEVFFTMKLVQGVTLKDILRGLRREDPEFLADYPRLRLINIFQSVCQAIAFAHSRGVIHRDIKPSNVMVGEYGEVLVLDWGVAKVLGSDENLPDEVDGVITERSTSGDSTMMGLVTGTPSYMPPEQAAGRIDRLDERSDIYALGALLYEILALRPPYKKKTHRDTLRAVIKDPLKPPTMRAPERGIPARLEEVCLRCLRKRSAERYASVQEVIDALLEYQAGVEERDRRIRRSEERFQVGLNQIAEFDQHRARVSELDDAVQELEWNTPGHADLQAKRTLWAAQNDLEAAEQQKQELFTAACASLVEAIGFNQDNEEACNELARLYWYRMTEAGEQGDVSTASEYRKLVRLYNRGAYTQLLRGEGRLNVRSIPSGAEVTAERLDEVDRQLRAAQSISLGPTPISNHALPPGRWIIKVKAAGFRDVILPSNVQNANVVDLSCHCFTDEEIGKHYLYVPGGPVSLGGDPGCASARHRRIAEVADLFVARYQVTCAEYLAFIRDLERKDPERALARTPRTRVNGGQLWSRDDDGKTQLPSVDRQGFTWEAHWPIFGISFDDADAYCRWYSARTGMVVRLPTEDEWEKAARGLDGRFYPWGDRFDATFCKMAASRSGTPMPERVGSFRTDCSPYGLYDVAGLVREYCNSPFARDTETRVVRGGSYLTANELGCRVTYRQSVQRNIPSLDHGFRVVRDVGQVQGTHERKMVRPQF